MEKNERFFGADEAFNDLDWDPKQHICKIYAIAMMIEQSNELFADDMDRIGVSAILFDAAFELKDYLISVGAGDTKTAKEE